MTDARAPVPTPTSASAVVRLLLDACATVPRANGAAPEALVQERDEALARCRALEAELSALRARLAAA
jgi:hypothetical protein